MDINNMSASQFARLKPNGVVVYKLQWEVHNIRPSVLLYPSFLITRPVNCGTTTHEFYTSDLNGKNLKRIGVRAFFDYSFDTVEVAKESFSTNLRRCYEGRVKWLEEGSAKATQVAETIFKKLDKM